MKRVKVFSPRRQPVVVELESSNTFADARARIRQEFKAVGSNDVLLLHGEVMKDSEVVGDKLSAEEEVLCFMEVLAPPKPAAAPAANPFMGIGGAGRGMGRGMGGPPGQGGGATAENLANILMQMQQARQRQGGAAAGGAAQPAARQPSAAAANAAPRQPAAAAGQAARPRQQAEVPPALVSQLTEMGFSEAKARRALLVSSLDVLDAITWLSEHADDPDVDPPAGQPSAPPLPAAAVPAQPSEAVKGLLPVLDPVLQAIALVAHGEGALRANLEGVRLPAMEADGWRGFAGAVQRVWAGERREQALCGALDTNTAALMRQVLRYAGTPVEELRAAMGRDARAGLPKDPEFEKIEVQMLPMLRRVATMAVQQAKAAMGEGTGCPAEEEKAIMDFVTQMEGANWQLRTPLEMLCAGVRTPEDLLECVAPLPSGKPDDRSARLALSVMAIAQQIEAGG